MKASAKYNHTPAAHTHTHTLPAELLNFHRNNLVLVQVSEQIIIK